MAIPSVTAMVANSRGVPPAALPPSLAPPPRRGRAVIAGPVDRIARHRSLHRDHRLPLKQSVPTPNKGRDSWMSRGTTLLLRGLDPPSKTPAQQGIPWDGTVPPFFSGRSPRSTLAL